jgi:hypothetical protein
MSEGDARLSRRSLELCLSRRAHTGRAGPLFENFLREQGARDATTERAVKRVLAFQLAAAMQEQHITKVEMAARLETSRAQLDDRLLDPENDSVTLAALSRAARAVGRTLKIELQSQWTRLSLMTGQTEVPGSPRVSCKAPSVA